jgi:hypothetical protein
MGKREGKMEETKADWRGEEKEEEWSDEKWVMERRMERKGRGEKESFGKEMEKGGRKV